MVWLTTTFYLIKKFYLAIPGLLAFFLVERNSKLSEKNKKLSNAVQENKLTIKVQNEVIHALQSNKPATLNTNIKRMHNKEL